LGDSGVLGAHVSWVGRPGQPGDLSLSVGGLDTRTDEHLRWPDAPEIKVGDAITIQVIETDTVEEPTERKTPAQLIEDEKAFRAEIEANRQSRLAARADDELPPFRAPWESVD
jgi:hypothetical protein